MIDLASLPPCEIAGRLDRLRAAMAHLTDEARVDALIVTSLPNIRYLTGFTGSAAKLVVLADGAVLSTDGRYRDQAAAQLRAAGVDAEISITRTVQAQRADLAQIVSAQARIGLEAAAVTWAEQRALAEVFDGAEIVATVGLVEALRAVKDAGEVARIEAACDIASAALADVIGLVDDEPTERDFAHALEAAMRRLGASGPSFDTIVSVGANGAMPHHSPDATVIIAGELLVIDYGCVVDGYCSDMTRTMVVGEERASWQRELIDAATAAQAAGVAAVRPGLIGSELHATCQLTLDELGVGELFTHGTGHGVGLQIHESPWAGITATDVLQIGNVITVEPGVYRVGLGGARVEDTVVVTEDGCRPLTKTPKDLSCLRSPRTT
jgi:Xaa-Pro aminopeptidase